MAWSYTESGNNTASTSWAVSHPAASTGDLLIFNIAWDDSTNVTGLTPPSGPNGETAEIIEDVVASASTAVRGKIVYYVATGSWGASTIAFTPSASEQWSAVVIKVPTGEFDATTPIGAHNNYPSPTTSTTPPLPTLTAGATDGGGTLVGVYSTDKDDLDGTVSGWTVRISRDRGAVGIDVMTRDATVTNSESISAVSGWTVPLARNYVSFIYIVRPLGVTTHSASATASLEVTATAVATLFEQPDPTAYGQWQYALYEYGDDPNIDRLVMVFVYASATADTAVTATATALVIKPTSATANTSVSATLQGTVIKYAQASVDTTVSASLGGFVIRPASGTASIELSTALQGTVTKFAAGTANTVVTTSVSGTVIKYATATANTEINASATGDVIPNNVTLSASGTASFEINSTADSTRTTFATAQADTSITSELTGTVIKHASASPQTAFTATLSGTVTKYSSATGEVIIGATATPTQIHLASATAETTFNAYLRYTDSESLTYIIYKAEQVKVWKQTGRFIFDYDANTYYVVGDYVEKI